ncbi:MAG: hypothetical protein R3B06_04860 [Kofleriaceae bacterium]
MIGLAVAMSVVGALAFFMAGRATRPAAVEAAPPPPPTAAPPPPGPDPAVAALTHQVQLMDQRRAAAEAEAAHLRAALIVNMRGRLTMPVADPTAPHYLQRVTDELTLNPGLAALVVADDLGLLVAGSAARGDELAALGGFLAGAGDRARSLAALGPVARVMVEDIRGATASVTPLPGTALVAVAVQEPPEGPRS